MGLAEKLFDWLGSKWNGITGTEAEGLRQMGAVLKDHLEVKSAIIARRPDGEVPSEKLTLEAKEWVDLLRDPRELERRKRTGR